MLVCDRIIGGQDCALLPDASAIELDDISAPTAAIDQSRAGRRLQPADMDRSDRANRTATDGLHQSRPMSLFVSDHTSMILPSARAAFPADHEEPLFLSVVSCTVPGGFIYHNFHPNSGVRRPRVTGRDSKCWQLLQSNSRPTIVP